MMLEGLTIESFRPHVGTGFTIKTEEREEVLTLTAVEAGKAAFEGAREAFSLLFKGSSNDLMFHSQMVHFTHPEMGELSLTISPYNRMETGEFQYEAIFN